MRDCRSPASDIETLRTIDRQLELYQEDMRKQFAYHLDRIENIIAKMILGLPSA